MCGDKMSDIIVAGGCFWGVEEYYRRLKGIVSTQVGYVNGSKDNLTYQEVCLQKYQAIEAVKLCYDENVISLEKILDHLFRIIDPTSLDKQGNDIGISYRVGAYYENEKDKEIIEKFIFKKQNEYLDKIVFEVKSVKTFSKAEDYHQEYLMKNNGGYCHVDFSLIRSDELK
ncbi:peptide-methionine (S)-S-oxide reductase [Bacilli bacterium PM5-3]|nr:peptide-methionine (S)-S-oxide reductase [Bacilli bacterium PM5-3]MDH6604027.1 peptide-methionine (S)-S-oxide reductase [Bacilli bacterium PM5-9]